LFFEDRILFALCVIRAKDLATCGRAAKWPPRDILGAQQRSGRQRDGRDERFRARRLRVHIPRHRLEEDQGGDAD